MARQLTFDLAQPPALGRADYLVMPANALAVTTLDAPESWPQGRMLLTGPEGAGKTHLAAIWAAGQGAQIRAATALDVEGADALCGQGGALVIEDADRIGGQAGPEQALFHILNLATARGLRLLLTARGAPRDWGLALPDLASRIGAMAQTRLGAPDETLLAAVLVKLFADRQLVVPPDLIGWLAARMDRDLGLARRLVAALDAESIAEKRPVTRRKAALMLDKLDETGQ